MSPNYFFTRLVLVCLLQAGLSLVLMFFSQSAFAHLGFISVTILAMALFCTMLFVIAKRIVQSSISRIYIQFIMLAVFLKMILCVSLIAIYKSMVSSGDYSYVWPFLIIYLTSSVYEVIFLEKVGREKQTARQ